MTVKVVSWWWILKNKLDKKVYGDPTENRLTVMNQRDTDALLMVLFGWLSFVILIATVNLIVAIVRAVIEA